MGRKAQDELDLGSWLILRMASADTLRVVKALKGEGMDVWAPLERMSKRLPRSRARVDSERAIVPSYAFGHVKHFDELMKLAMMPRKDIPKFSVFHHQGGVPLIADGQLAALRKEEERCNSIFEKAKRKFMKGPTFEKGETVSTDEGGFAGLSGIVEGTQGQYTLVSFAGFHAPIKIASLLLTSDVVRADLQEAA